MHDLGDGSELSKEQRYALQRFQAGENVFVSGPGGSGKSHLIRYLVQDLYRNGRIHQVTSTTGCSAILLSNQIRVAGKPIVVKTIHSWSGIRLGRGPLSEIVRVVFRSRRTIKEWRRCRTLILDEISMLSKKLFTVLEYLARYIRGNDLPFGGMQVVCLGDFFQLPPVGDADDPDSMAFAFESPAWGRVFSMENHVELTTVYRQVDDTYKRMLNEVRLAEMSEESKRMLQERVGLPYRAEDHNGVCPVKLFATRNQVSRVNAYQYGLLTGDERMYSLEVGTDTWVYIETGENLEPDVVTRCREMTSLEVEMESKALVTQVPVEERLMLKVGVPVMCLVNLDVDAGIANGSMGVVVDFVLVEDARIWATGSISGGSKKRMVMAPLVQFHNGIRRPIGPYVWQSTEFPRITVAQTPLTLAYASSIHKMQGATLDVAEMDLGGSIFAEHQTYVALSRVRSLEGVYLTSFHPHRVRVNPRVVEFYRSFAGSEVEEAEEEEEEEEEDMVAPVAAAPVEQGCGCPICLEDMLDVPYDTACGHRFCLECISRLIYCSLDRVAACPICREPVSMRSLKAVVTAGGGAKKKPLFKKGVGSGVGGAGRDGAGRGGIRTLLVHKNT